jgi:hypothetical protein
LGTSNIPGSLAVTLTAGGLDQSGPVVVKGDTTLTPAATGSITLTNSKNNFNTVIVTQGANVSLRDTNSIVLNKAASTFSITGDLSVQASLSSTTRGSITQGDKLTVLGTTTLAVGTASKITLDNTSNALTDAVSITSAGDVTLYNKANTTLNGCTVTGNLTVNTASATGPVGTISDGASGRLVVGKIATFTVPSTADNIPDITLDNAANNFGAVVVTNANDVALVDVTGLILGTVTVTDNAGDASSLSVTTGGAITQAGTLTVPGTTTLNATSAGNIVLSKSTNNFTGAVTITGRNVTIRDAGAVEFGASTIAGTFDVTAGGAITDSGQLDITGKATLVATSGVIELDGAAAAGDKLSQVSVKAAGNVTLKDVTGDLDLATSKITGTGTLSVTNTLGSLTQSGPLVVAGTTTLNIQAATGDVTLTNSSNNFSTVAITAARNVSLRDLNALNFGASTLTNSGDLDVTVRGALTQTAATALTVPGTTTLATGSTSKITLNQSNALTGAVTITSAGTVTLQNTVATVLGESSMTGDLTLTNTAGGISQTGPLVVGKLATFSAAGLNVTLSDENNNFRTVVASGLDVAITDLDAVMLGASTVTGKLDVTAGSGISQSGALAVTGVATLKAGPTSGIALNSSNNNFASAVKVTAGGNVALRDTTDNLDLGESTVGGTLDVTATAGAITDSGTLTITGKTTLSSNTTVTLDYPSNDFSEVGVTSATIVQLNDAGALVLGTSTMSGTLTVTTAGDLTQSGPVTATTATLTATNSDIKLLDDGNDFDKLVVNSNTQNVAVTDKDALDLGACTIAGTFDLTTGGAITDSGALAVNGATTLAAGSANDITLDYTTTSHNLSEVAVTSGKDVTLKNGSNALTLGSSTVAGKLAVTSLDLDQSGPLSVTGTMSLAVTGAITLNDPENAFHTVEVTGGAATDVTLENSGDVQLGTTTLTGAGSLVVHAIGQISDSDIVTVPGTTTLTAEADGGGYSDITLDSGALLTGAVSLTGKDVYFTQARVTLLGVSTASGTFTVIVTGGGQHADEHRQQ